MLSLGISAQLHSINFEVRVSNTGSKLKTVFNLYGILLLMLNNKTNDDDNNNRFKLQEMVSLPLINNSLLLSTASVILTTMSSFCNHPGIQLSVQMSLGIAYINLNLNLSLMV